MARPSYWKTDNPAIQTPYNVGVLVLAPVSRAQLNGKHEALRNQRQRVLPPQR